MKICIFGGTFDPIHTGHLIIAEFVRDALKLDQILFMPTNVPPHKNPTDITDASMRLEMTDLAIKENKHFKVSSYEIDKGGISYTVDTLQYLRDNLGLKNQDTFLLIGADSLLDLESWHRPDRIVNLCRIVVVRRPGCRFDDSINLYAKEILEIDAPLLDISSTEIRRRVKSGLSIRYLVPENVAKFIFDHGLYLL